MRGGEGVERKIEREGADDERCRLSINGKEGI